MDHISNYQYKLFSEHTSIHNAVLFSKIFQSKKKIGVINVTNSLSKKTTKEFGLNYSFMFENFFHSCHLIVARHKLIDTYHLFLSPVSTTHNSVVQTCVAVLILYIDVRS